MKKLIALTLILSVLLAGVCLFVSADEEPAPAEPTLGTEDLLALWDFEEGDNIDLVNGAKLWRMDGTENKDMESSVKIENGVAHVAATSETLYLQYSQRVKTGYSGHENKTIFTKFYYDGTAANGDAAIVWHRSNDFSVTVTAESSSERYAFTARLFGTTVEVAAECTPEKPVDQWYYLALTIGTYNTETHTVEVNLYLSADGDAFLQSTWQIEIAEENVDKMLRPAKAEGQTELHSYFAFGKTATKYGADKTTGVDIYYDEIRLYNLALTAEQIPYLKDAVEFPEEPETTPSTPSSQSPTVVTRTPSTQRTPSTTTAPTNPVTNAPTDSSTSVPATSAPVTDGGKTGGCASLVAPGALMLLLSLSGAIVLGRKKER